MAGTGTDKAIVLFAHGARDPRWAEPLSRLAEMLAQGEDAPAVQLAFLELMSPGLEEAVARVVDGGASTVLVLPVFLAQGGHLRRDLPALIEATRQRHPELHIELALAVGEDQGVLRAIADYARRSLDSC